MRVSLMCLVSEAVACHPCLRSHDVLGRALEHKNLPTNVFQYDRLRLAEVFVRVERHSLFALFSQLAPAQGLEHS